MRRRQPRRCNDLDGRRWMQNSLSVWSDLRKTADELRLKHPAQFPVALVERLMESLLPAGAHTVLDPFCGSGSTLVAAIRRGKRAIGIELSPTYVQLAQQRLMSLYPDTLLSVTLNERGECSLEESIESEEPEVKRFGTAVIHQASVSRLKELIPAESIDLCVTSPPYWNILNQKRTADAKPARHYGNLEGDLGLIADYESYLTALTTVFQDVWHVLRPGAYCCIVVMDLRKRDQFYPLHSDLASRLQGVGYRWDDLIIWNRQAEYNFLRPLGYPTVFRINKVHEFILLMLKPR